MYEINDLFNMLHCITLCYKPSVNQAKDAQGGTNTRPTFDWLGYACTRYCSLWGRIKYKIWTDGYTIYVYIYIYIYGSKGSAVKFMRN